MKAARVILTLVLIFVAAVAAAQDYISPVKSDLVPPTPQSTKFVEYQAPQPSMLTGTVDLTIPIYSISSGDYTLPVYLQYHSSGIKVADDPCPTGYGWALMPALRATRTILGRPDEHFEFKADIAESNNAQDLAYQCMVKPHARSFDLHGRYDSQHDIISFALPSGTVTRVIDCSEDTINFRGGLDDEYRVRALNENLDSISVTDGYGVKYIFGAPYEPQTTDSYVNSQYRTSWALTSIVLPGGKTINLSWSLQAHEYMNRQILGGDSFMDHFHINIHEKAEEFDNSSYLSATFQPVSNNPRHLTLDAITFPLGKLIFDYGSNGYGIILQNITVQSIVNNISSTVRNINLRYGDDNSKPLLTSVEINDEEVYEMNYNEQTASSDRWYSQDWWGYYNAKENTSLTPKLKLRRYTSDRDSIGYYTPELGEADRSVDTIAMQANILTKITYPTGGYSSFEYEAHHFAPRRLETAYIAGNDTTHIIHPDYDPYLSYGGGLRVKRITTATGANDPTPRIVDYRYSPAVVRAVPSMATFISAHNSASAKPDAWDGPDTDVLYMRSVNISPYSDYMRYDIGETPLWYERVEAIYAEGKQVFSYRDVNPSHNQIFTDNSSQTLFRSHRNLHRIFSRGPQLVAKATYKTSADGAGYDLVEKDSMQYQIISAYGINATQIERILLHVSLIGSSTSTPDFDDGKYAEARFRPISTNPYSIVPYSIIPSIERLSRETKTLYTDNGTYTTSKSYSYRSGTSLIAEYGSTNSDGENSLVSLSYPSASLSDIETQMVAANAVALPVKQITTKGATSVTIEVDYMKVGSTFRQRRLRTTYDDGTTQHTQDSPTYEYDALGNLRCVTDLDSISTTWLWGYEGCYPVYQIAGVDFFKLKRLCTQVETTEAQNITLPSTLGYPVRKFTYKALVGLSEDRQPWGSVASYTYDSSGRLTSTAISALGTLCTIEYSIGHDVENFIRETRLGTNAATNHSITTHYDGLGRQIRNTDNASGIAMFMQYDSMGRLMRQSMPTSEPPGTYEWQLSEYEASPRAVLTVQTKAGELWHSQGKAVTTRLLTNTATGEYACPRYTISPSGLITHHGNYPAGTLLVKETTNEDRQSVRIFTDMAGRELMSSEGAGSSWLSTRRIYDEFGRLRCVLPPNIDDGNCSTSDGELADKAFINEYDAVGNLILQKTPGCSPSLMRYSRAGRLVAEHTPSMLYGQYLLSFYDTQGRTAFTATARPSNSILQGLCENLLTASYTGGGDFGGYALSADLACNLSLQKVSYYDSYAFADTIATLAFAQDEHLNLTKNTNTMGLLTGERDFVASSAGLGSAFYYDHSGRLVQQVRQQLVGTQRNSFAYDKQDKLMAGHEIFVHKAGRIFDRLTTNRYDSAERLLSTSISENGSTATFSYTYGSNGKLATELCGNSVSRNFSYDIHGWLCETSINVRNSDFALRAVTAQYYDNISAPAGIIDPINPLIPPVITPIDTLIDKPIALLRKIYTDRLYYADGMHPRYSGCPSARTVTLGGTYDYVFDVHNRLTEAIYTPGVDNAEDEDFSVSYTYNTVGSPTSLLRKGVISYYDDDSESFGTLDSLSYVYNGNQVSEIHAAGEGSDFYGRVGYPTSVSGYTGYYDWHESGLLMWDSANDVNISYNRFGLPSMINGNLSTQALSYNAEGVLIRKRNTPRGGTSTHLDYAGDRIFEGDSLVYSYFPGGYFDGEGAVHYMHADYQGNISMVTDSVGYIEQHNGYYPYGEPWREPTGQPRLYGGKERERFMALNYYDFHARQLNSATAHWNAPDALAFKYPGISPYTYCAANPIMYADSTGMDIAILLVDGFPGHLAMLIQDKNDKWQYYSFNGDNIYASTSGSLGGNKDHNVGDVSFNSVQGFLNSNFNSVGTTEQKESDQTSGYEYDRAFVIKTTDQQDKAAAKEFKSKAKNSDYSLLFNNCAQVVADALEKAGIELDWVILTPSGTYDDVIERYSGIQYKKKKNK